MLFEILCKCLVNLVQEQFWEQVLMRRWFMRRWFKNTSTQTECRVQYKPYYVNTWRLNLALSLKVFLKSKDTFWTLEKPCSILREKATWIEKICESWKRKQILSLDTCSIKIGIKYLDEHFSLKNRNNISR